MNTSRAILNQQHVDTFLSQCGLSEYFETFIEEGFDRPESLMEITETDLIQMQVKRGHRRLLQRAVANAKGIPTSVPLNITPINNNSNKSDVTAGDSRFRVPLYEQQQQQQGYNNNKKPLQPNEVMDVSLQLLAGTASSSSGSSSSATNTSPASTNTSTSSPSLNLQQQQQQHIQQQQQQSQPPNTTHAMTEYFPSAGTMTHSAQSGMSSTEEEAVTSDNVHRLWKRKYHRHAKPDTNAPLKPPSAYVMFSNDVRAELKQQNKSFTDLAKIIGDRWKNITPEEKELYEVNALRSREDYLKQMEEYHKTESYRKYQQYISDFKTENEAAARPVGRPRKRHRRDGDKYGSDGTVSDSTKPKRASSISSQPEEHTRTPSMSSEQRQYPFYLLNEESTVTMPK
ncbi:uncharacterized protein EV154DRAFT_509989 [Mucor mucedo]|uniref:uncharacterized protein n=1 Tax=Mucor mucedo TaxID=29922 RepID=UPI00221EA329|nr:uncharacterized protein EV154DRAFT_509989 [Mucor mucedo]KAI7890919.1 hypothetical protein EV154DRAFT_509989 [Mucor mucedo]